MGLAFSHLFSPNVDVKRGNFENRTSNRSRTRQWELSALVGRPVVDGTSNTYLVKPGPGPLQCPNQWRKGSIGVDDGNAFNGALALNQHRPREHHISNLELFPILSRPGLLQVSSFQQVGIDHCVNSRSRFMKMPCPSSDSVQKPGSAPNPKYAWIRQFDV